MSLLLLRSSLRSLQLDGVLLSAHTHSSVCGSLAKSRTLYGEWCHLRFGLTITSGTHKDCSYRDDDVCIFGLHEYENMLLVW